MSFDEGATLADRMRTHAGDEQHLYGHLMRAMADDWEHGGPVRQICVGWEDSPVGTVVQLRLLAGLFRLVLRGEAPELLPYYACLGGTAPPQEAWPDVRRVLALHVAELSAALDVAPQTNEPGRSAALLVGLFEAVRRTGLTEVRLWELGASAGLNLLVDRYWIQGPGWTHGPGDSPVRLPDAVVGRAVQPAAFSIVERRGCDVAPIDACSDEGRLRLRSFVWPWQLTRHDRLAGALEIAADIPVEVDRCGAADWLSVQLGDRSDRALTVVWQSVTGQYWPRDEVARVDALLAEAAHGGAPIARVIMEYPLSGPVVRPTLSLAVGPGDLDVLADVADHGVPVVLRSSAA
jgi:hypothetical protein